MRKINILFSMLCFLVCSAQAQTSPLYSISTHLGASGAVIAPRATVRDAAGNLYVTDGFQDTVDFDPSLTATANLTAANTSLYCYVFIAKYLVQVSDDRNTITQKLIKQ